MRILLDECLPKSLSAFLIGHDVVTVVQSGWSGIKNGKLLSLAQDNFDAFVTVDQNLPDQQNLSKYKITIIIIQSNSNQINELTKIVPVLLELLSTPISGVYRI